MQLSNYLFFTTACEPALAFYGECGLGRVTLLVRHGDGGLPVHNEAMRGKVMHAKFEGPGVEFYASDNDDAEPMRGSAHMLTMDDREQTRRLFEKLAVGGHNSTAARNAALGQFLRQAHRPVRRAVDAQLRRDRR
jgi:PhnB protein